MAKGYPAIVSRFGGLMGQLQAEGTIKAPLVGKAIGQGMLVGLPEGTKGMPGLMADIGSRGGSSWSDSFVSTAGPLIDSGIRSLFDSVFGGSWWGQLASGAASSFAGHFLDGMGGGGGGGGGVMSTVGSMVGKHFLSGFGSVAGGAGAAATAGTGAAGAGASVGGGLGAGVISGLAAVPVAGWVAIGVIGAVALWKGFSGPSKAEKAARASFASVHDAAVDQFGQTGTYIESVQRLVADGWDQTLAETVAGFEHAAAAAGVSHAEAVELYRQYQIAVQEGNVELVADIEATYQSWIDEANRAEAEATAAAQRATNAAVSAYREAGKKLPTPTKTYEAAIEAGR